MKAPICLRPRATLLALSLVWAPACQSGGGASLLEAGARPTAARLASDVAWLADDAREGRRAGTEGERVSAEWIAARFEDLGLRAAGERGYLQGFSVPLPARDTGASFVRAGATRYEGEEACLPLFCSSGSTAAGPLAFRGYGIEHAARGWSDYAEGGDLDGRVVLLVRGTPPAEVAPLVEDQAPAASPHGPGGDPGWGNAGSIFRKVMNAKRRGAVAVLVAPHPERADEPLLAFDPGQTGRAAIPALVVSAELADALLPGWRAAIAAADAGEAARPLAEAPAVEVSAGIERGRAEALNVLARLPGGDGPTVVLGAHYDHLGFGGSGSLARDSFGSIHNGADDNASGTAVVLEMARVLASGEPPEGDVVFALWSGEELGLLGSRHWLENPTVDLEDVSTNLNFDMVGRAGGGALSILGAGSSPAFAGWMDEGASRSGLELSVELSGQGVGGSDHQSFLLRQIPALHLFSGLHADYHRPSDDAPGFEAEGARRVAELALFLLDRVQASPKLAYAPPSNEEGEGPGRQRGSSSMRAWLGSVPADYSDDSDTGVLLAGTSPGSPAERAGLLADDRLTRLGDVEIQNIFDLVDALSLYKPGDVVRVVFEREGREEEVLLTLSSREVE